MRTCQSSLPARPLGRGENQNCGPIPRRWRGKGEASAPRAVQHHDSTRRFIHWALLSNSRDGYRYAHRRTHPRAPTPAVTVTPPLGADIPGSPKAAPPLPALTPNPTTRPPKIAGLIRAAVTYPAVCNRVGRVREGRILWPGSQLTSKEDTVHPVYSVLVATQRLTRFVLWQLIGYDDPSRNPN